MKIAFLLVLLKILFGTSNVLGQSLSKTVKDISFDNVLIYEFDPSPEEPDFRRLIKHSNDQLEMASGLKRSYITVSEQKVLYKFLMNRKSFNNGSSICWEPHLGIVFLEKDVAVNYISICMECNKLRSMALIPAAKVQKSTNTIGIRMEKGLSPAFREFINSLLIRYDFKYATKPNSSP